MEEYRGYKFWLVETTALGQKWWRIEYPSGFHVPPLPYRSKAHVERAIDLLIAASPAG